MVGVVGAVSRPGRGLGGKGTLAVSIAFVKMHGLGNDYLYVDVFTSPEVGERADWPELARAMSDRHRGVGSDGLILVARPRAGVDADVRMRMFNSDGSESEMCGNGVRCVAKFVHDRLGIRPMPGRAMRVETGRGVLAITYTASAGRLESATVDMGEPILDLPAVPVAPEHLAEVPAGGGRECGLLQDGRRYAFTPVSMGNPHAVFFGQGLDLRVLGPRLEHHPAFPRRSNIHDARVVDRAHAVMTPWERGAGFTQACGTGACAVLVAGVLTGRLDRRATVTLPGGDLLIEWDEASGHVFMTGPAADVFEGTWRTEPNESDLPVLRTERLVLRPLEPGDAEAVRRLADNPRVSEHLLTMPSPYTIADAHRIIASTRRPVSSGGWANWAIVHGEGGSAELVGVIGLRLEANQRRAEVGYWLGEAYWGRGFVPEALRAVVGWAFEGLGLNKVWAGRFAENAASGRVLEKVGFRLEGTLREHLQRGGRFRDDVVYGLLKSEWTP